MALTPAVVLVLLSWLLGQAQTPPPAVAVTTIHYAVISEDDPANRGDLAVPIRTGGDGTAAIWESACRLQAQAGQETPGDSEQTWTFRLTAARLRGGPAVRVEYRHVPPNGGAPRPGRRTIALDGRDALVLTAFSARRDCRYDRMTISVTAVPGR